VKRYGDLAAIQIGFEDISRDWFTLLFGLGPGSYSPSQFTNYTSPYVLAFFGRNLPTHENSLSMFLAEFGFLGTGLYVCMSLYLLFKIVAMFRVTTDKEIKAMSFGLAALGVGYMIGAPYRSYWTSFPESFIFWCCSFLLLVEHRRRQEVAAALP
jgi:O-antigen ligase